MGTRSLVKVEGLESALYKHWDGYPSNMLPWLTEFYSTFFDRRGFDDSYCLAQLIRSSVYLGVKHNIDPSTETGYGVVNATDKCGQEYTYELCENGNIKVNGKVAWKKGDKP